MTPQNTNAQGIMGLASQFNPDAYLRANPDVAKSGMTAQQHYDNFGRYEGRDPMGVTSGSQRHFWDSPEWAPAQPVRWDQTATQQWGMDLPVPEYRPTWFNWKTYLGANQDLLGAGIDTELEALRHFNAFGKKEGRQGVAPVPVNATPVTWDPTKPVPKTAGGRDFLTWGGDKNIQGQMYAVDPDVYDKLLGQLANNRSAGAQYGLKWTAGEKNTDVPDEFVQDMAKSLAASGITDIRQIGKKKVETGVVPLQRDKNGRLYTVESFGAEGNESLVPVPEHALADVEERDGQPVLVKKKDVIFNKVSGQPIISQYGGRTNGSQGIFGGTYKGDGNTGYQVLFDAKGNPYFRTVGASSSDIGKLAPLLTVLSFVPGVAPIAMAANAAIAADQGNWTGALLSGLGAIPGINQLAGLGMSADTLSTLNTVRQGAGIVNAIGNKDWVGAALGAAGAAGVEKLPGTNISLADAAKYVKVPRVLEAAKNGNPLAIAQIVSAVQGTTKRAVGGLMGEAGPDKVEASRILRDLPPDQARMLSGIAANF